MAAGSKSPLLFFAVKDEKRFPQAGIVAVLGAMKATYVPLETREQVRSLSGFYRKLFLHVFD